MAILSKRLMSDVRKAVLEEHDANVLFVNPAGHSMTSGDRLAAMSNTRRRRSYAMQESVNLGEPYVFEAAPGIMSWVMGLEDRRVIHGGVVGGAVVIEDKMPISSDTITYMTKCGMGEKESGRLVSGLASLSADRVREVAAFAHYEFYRISGWQPDLTNENRTKVIQKQQLAQAIHDLRKSGEGALYAFEKERVLLANIRAGDRNQARRILNEMLASIYMSSPKLIVLRARAIEMVSCLTRAAIEDNPLLEPLIESNHQWTERLISATSFEDLSQVLMSALDDFIDGIYLHGVNRSNMNVRKALDFIRKEFRVSVSLKDIAGHVGLSPCRLAHLVKECTGKTSLQILQETRIQHAQRLLERTSMSCADVAYESGFGDQSYFTKHFKRLTGSTPARYRRSRG